MLYRVLIGFIPMLLVALFVSGAIPLGSVLPTSEYRSSAVRAADAEAKKEEAGKPYRARTPEGMVSQQIGVLPAGAIEMMEDNMQAVGEMQRVTKEIEKDRRRGARAPGWKPKSSGWGAHH